mgnify:CR=1 FL=1
MAKNKNETGQSNALWGFGPFSNLYDFKNKKQVAIDLQRYMFDRTQAMFDYKNLPETIPKRFLELYLQSNGLACVGMANDKLYVFFGTLGGVPDEYYIPTQFIVVNPYLKFSHAFTRDVDGIVIKNDSMYMGLSSMFARYSTLLAENYLSIKIASINKRLTTLLSASDESTRLSAELYMKKLEDGDLSVISESAFLDGVKAQPYAVGSVNQMTELIELQQYIESKWYNDIGLQANYNMKRESLSSNELGLNNGLMLPLIDDMLECRERGIDKVNAMFGTNIIVSRSSAWKDIKEEETMAVEKTRAEIENTKAEIALEDSSTRVEGGEEHGIGDDNSK